MASDLVSRRRLAREKSLPDIPSSLGGEALVSLGAMREQVERLSGKAGDISDRAVRLFEVEMGLLSAYIPTGTDVARSAQPGSGGTRILKAPRNLQYAHQIFGIKLTWENSEETYSAVEIWCAEESTFLDDAWRVGIATKPMSEWTMHGISMRINYTFWIRAVDWGGGVSPWCPPQGQGGLLVPAQIDETVGEVLELLTGRVTESHLYTDLNARISQIDEHSVAIQEQALVIDGLEAQWFVKLDVDGRVSGVGLHGTGATSEFVVLADKFMVVTPGETPKVPFVVGPMGDTGENGVGIDGNMVVNGTVLTRHLSADSVTADKIGADQVSGQHIAATSEITLNEGGKLTVGQNNVILDSTENKIIIAPDNGTIIGQEDLSGIDYCELAQGDISFMYWNGASHQLYNSLKRVEMGMECINGVRVTIPGIWKEQPKIIVSPASIMSYNKNYDAHQTLICMAENIIKVGNSYAFTPRAYLRLTNGQVGLGINLATNVAYGGLEEDIWHYSNTSSRNTPPNTTTITVSGSATTEYWVSRTWANDGHPTTSYSSERAYIRIWIVVDGAQYYVGEWSAKQVGIAGYNFTTTITGLATGVHTYYVRMGLMNSSDIHWSSGGPGEVKGSVTATREVTNQSTYQVLADGTLNYLAIGE